MKSIGTTLLLVTFGQLTFGFGEWEGNNYDMNKGVHQIKKGQRSVAPQPTDELIFTDKPKMMPQRSPAIQLGSEFCYPPRGSLEQVTITMYEVVDKEEGTDGALAFEKSGGPGQNQVCFYIKSQMGEGINYEINVYGYRLNKPGMGAGGFGGVGNNGMGMGVGMGTPGFGGVGNNGMGMGNNGMGVGMGNNGMGTPGYGGFGNSNPGFNNNGANGNGFIPIERTFSNGNNGQNMPFNSNPQQQYGPRFGNTNGNNFGGNGLDYNANQGNYGNTPYPR